MDVLRMLNPKFGTLLTAAELGSFTRAAAALNFTQPAVSHQISQLEQQLGVTLFVRAKGKISLTPEGEIVVQYVRRMKALEQQLLDDLQSADRRLTRLRVGIMGGTFDPIHTGHLVAASEVSWVYDLDEVIFEPPGRPVFKLDKNVTNAEDRYLMTVIATASNPKFTVSRVDIDRPGVT